MGTRAQPAGHGGGNSSLSPDLTRSRGPVRWGEGRRKEEAFYWVTRHVWLGVEQMRLFRPGRKTLLGEACVRGGRPHAPNAGLAECGPGPLPSQPPPARPPPRPGPRKHLSFPLIPDALNGATLEMTLRFRASSTRPELRGGAVGKSGPREPGGGHPLPC